MKTGVFVAITFLSACGAGHIKDYTPKRREYDPIVKSEDAPTTNEDGSLWSDRAEGATLFTDVRAFQVNDLVTVKIAEVATAKRNANTGLERDGNVKLGGDVAGILAEQSAGLFDPQEILKGGASMNFDATGRTSRQDDVRFTVAATVTKVLPNGNLFIEGHRVVLVNDEEHHFYISGVARPQDIRRDNSITSTLLADAEVEFTGAGVISEGQQPGWLTRLLNWISPF